MGSRGKASSPTPGFSARPDDANQSAEWLATKPKYPFLTTRFSNERVASRCGVHTIGHGKGRRGIWTLSDQVSVYMRGPKDWEQIKSWNSHIDFESTEQIAPKRAFGSDGHDEDHPATYPPLAYPTSAYPPSRLIRTWDLQRYRIPRDWMPEWKAPDPFPTQTDKADGNKPRADTREGLESKGADATGLTSKIDNEPVDTGGSHEKHDSVTLGPTSSLDTIMRDDDQEPTNKEAESSVIRADIGGEAVNTGLLGNEDNVPSIVIPRTSPDTIPKNNEATRSSFAVIEYTNHDNIGHPSDKDDTPSIKVATSPPSITPKIIEDSKPASGSSMNKKSSDLKGSNRWSNVPASDLTPTVPKSLPSTIGSASPVSHATVPEDNATDTRLPKNGPAVEVTTSVPKSLLNTNEMVTPKLSYADILKSTTAATTVLNSTNKNLINGTSPSFSTIPERQKPSYTTLKSKTGQGEKSKITSDGGNKGSAIEVTTTVSKAVLGAKKPAHLTSNTRTEKEETSGTWGGKSGKSNVPGIGGSTSVSAKTMQHDIIRRETNEPKAPISGENDNNPIRKMVAVDKHIVPGIVTTAAVPETGAGHDSIQVEIKETLTSASGDNEDNRAKHIRETEDAIPSNEVDASMLDTIAQQGKSNPETTEANNTIPENTNNNTNVSVPPGDENTATAIEITTTSPVDTTSRHYSIDDVGTEETLASELKFPNTQGFEISHKKTPAHIADMAGNADCRENNTMEQLSTHLSGLSVGQPEPLQQDETIAADQAQDENADESSKSKKKRKPKKKKNKSSSEAVPEVQFEGPYADGQFTKLVFPHTSDPYKILPFFIVEILDYACRLNIPNISG
ncbi:hypothetical protein ONS95_004437 [Cadophora gregata]|uniref:uncharacterized protein n=1 Tax=Cadophora gregata TaxID=51156 RepID=UPI0026DB5E0C|nr:uncharacterized protein ONS95_004437 [Cadophora gregata]KAK0105924.1 hypothetical protein ONS95_004437 [Cadophora gregata]